MNALVYKLCECVFFLHGMHNMVLIWVISVLNLGSYRTRSSTKIQCQNVFDFIIYELESKSEGNFFFSKSAGW